MPTSFQSPMRKDQTAGGSKSQTVNVQGANATVADILSTKGGDVFSIEPTETLGQAVQALRDRKIGALMVVQSGALVGILSERDIVRKLADTPGQTLPQQVQDVMTRDVKSCSSDAPLVDVLKQMTQGRFRHMPVVDDGVPTGMVTIGDAIQFRLSQLEHEALHLKQLIIG